MGVVGDSEAIDVSPTDSLEHAHVNKTVSEEEVEIVAQDEDELEPFLDFE